MLEPTLEQIAVNLSVPSLRVLARHIQALERATPAREDGPWKCLAEAETQRDAALARAERAERELAEALDRANAMQMQWEEGREILGETRAFSEKLREERDEARRMFEGRVRLHVVALSERDAARASAEKLREALLDVQASQRLDVIHRIAQAALDQAGAE